MPQSSAYSQFKPETRQAIEQRQAGNGFSDVDGLHEYIKELEDAYQRSRATTGRINTALKEATLEARKRAALSKALLEVMGPDAQDIALANTVMMDAMIQEALPHVKLSPAEIEMMEPEDKAALFGRYNLMSARNARSYAPLKKERKEDQDRLGNNQTSDEMRIRLQSRLASVLEAEKTAAGDWDVPHE